MSETETQRDSVLPTALQVPQLVRVELEISPAETEHAHCAGAVCYCDCPHFTDGRQLLRFLSHIRCVRISVDPAPTPVSSCAPLRLSGECCSLATVGSPWTAATAPACAFCFLSVPCRAPPHSSHSG